MPFEFEASPDNCADVIAEDRPAAPALLLPAALRDLVAALDGACELPPQHMAQPVNAALDAAAADPRLLCAAQRLGSAAAYQRHVLACDPDGRFTIVALVWWPGQHSPVHAHHTWCAYTVVDGTLSETLYQWDECSMGALAAGTRTRVPGAPVFSAAGRGGIHQLGNAGTAPAISLHIYGVAQEHVSTRVNECLQVAPPSH
jgi:predicted metal-dependent enzyme (double-stranded beta helix superfamily)